MMVSFKLEISFFKIGTVFATAVTLAIYKEVVFRD